mmetsp:Transcript_30076/g.68096  ORF Transcript_30076/g.68096 Transcript_30076/m.68096 type:complete len:208 (-) Transcript_30076:260-883(-)
MERLSARRSFARRILALWSALSSKPFWPSNACWRSSAIRRCSFNSPTSAALLRTTLRKCSTSPANPGTTTPTSSAASPQASTESASTPSPIPTAPASAAETAHVCSNPSSSPTLLVKGAASASHPARKACKSRAVALASKSLRVVGCVEAHFLTSAESSCQHRRRDVTAAASARRHWANTTCWSFRTPFLLSRILWRCADSMASPSS